LTNQRPILIIGIGNRHRGDDAVGVLVADRLKAQSIPGARVIDSDGDVSLLLDSWTRAASVVVVDALSSGAAPGTIQRVDARSGPLPAGFFHRSTHSMGLAEAVELGRIWNQLPSRLVIFGIEGRCFAVGAGVSPRVEEAAQEVVSRVLRELTHCRASRAPGGS